MHTHHSPVSTLPTSPYKLSLPLFSTNSLARLEGAPNMIGSPLPTQNCGLDIFCKVPNKTSPPSS